MQDLPHIFLSYNFNQNKNSIIDQTNFNKSFVFSDISTNFRNLKHQDIQLDYNLLAIRNSLTNIFLIPPYTIVGRPDFGIGLEQYLGEFADDVTKIEIENKIKYAIEKWEHRITLVDIEFNDDFETSNILIFTLHFRIVSDVNEDKIYQHPIRIME